jgi:hypothetical protein
VHDTLHVSDIKVSEGSRDPDGRRLRDRHVGIVKEEAAPAPAAEGEEPVEPEFIGKGKKDEEGEESE